MAGLEKSFMTLFLSPTYPPHHYAINNNKNNNNNNNKNVPNFPPIKN